MPRCCVTAATTTTCPTSTTDLMDNIAEQLKELRVELRGMMNGPVSASMRAKGLTYKLNFGVDAVRLQELAARLPHTRELAVALWGEDVREMRLLAPMVQPAEAFTPAEADEWVRQMRFPEEAEYTVMHLFARLPFASQKAFEWMAADEAMTRLCGFLLMARLLMKGGIPVERDAEELLDQAGTALHDADVSVRLAAAKCLVKFEDVCPHYSSRIDAMLDAVEG